MAVLSDAEASNFLAALMLFAHSTLRPRRCKSSSIASGFLPLTNIMVFTGSSKANRVTPMTSSYRVQLPAVSPNGGNGADQQSTSR